MGEGDTAIDALVGAAGTVLLSSWVPFAPVLGGAVAGYLQAGSRGDGLGVGAVSGLIALVPAVLFGVFLSGLFVSFVAGGAMGGMPLGLPAFGGAFLLSALVFGSVHVVGLSTVGGWIGTCVRHDADVDIDR